jgi:Ni2+-binding GTPase involved in maturation of urease and hydrogenase
MDRDARRMRGDRPFVFTCIRSTGAEQVAKFIETAGGLVEKGART